MSKKLFERIKEDKQAEDYYSMYLSLLPLMTKKVIEWKSFKDFLEENRPKKEKKIRETKKTDEEILKEINNIHFE